MQLPTGKILLLSFYCICLIVIWSLTLISLCCIQSSYYSITRQVADSSEINGRFKIEMRREKEGVRDSQRTYGEQIAIKRYDVVKMIRDCWPKWLGLGKLSYKGDGTH